MFFFFFFVIYRGDSVSQGLFFSCALSHNHNMSRFNSWVAGARVCFLPKETQQQPGIEPGTLRLPGRCPDHLAITAPCSNSQCKPMIMTRNDARKMMMIVIIDDDGCIWRLIIGDNQWCLVRINDNWWRLKTTDDDWWRSMMIDDGWWRSMMTDDDCDDDWWRLMMVDDDRW